MNEKNTFPDEWLVRAFATSDECPPPESFLEPESRALSRAERARNHDHADNCPACATERDLAESFDSPLVSEGADTDLDDIVARLERDAGWQPAGRNRRRGLPHLPVWALAVAALLVLGVLGVLRPTGPEAPGLPAFGGSAVTRGSHVDVIQPVGDLDSMPDSLTWQAISDATTYRVRLMRVDDTVLWEKSAKEASVDLSATVSGNLSPRVAYLWQVEALNESGKLVALSDRIRFRVVPPSVAPTSRDRQGTVHEEETP